MYSIEWHKRAFKQLKRVPNQDQRRIMAFVSELKQWPECRHVKALANHHCEYRLRVGNFRIFFDVDDHVRIIKIEEVKKRDERTY